MRFGTIDSIIVWAIEWSTGADPAEGDG